MKLRMTRKTAGVALSVVLGAAAVVSGQAAGSGGGIGSAPSCHFSLHVEANQWFNPECTRFFSCCDDYFGEDHGPMGSGTHSSLGSPVMVTCNGTVYVAAYVDGVCVNTGVYVGPMTCTVQVYPDAVPCQ